jgi:hypothetical protein
MRKAWTWSDLEEKDVIHSKECNKECNVSMLRTFAWSYGVTVLPPHEGISVGIIGLELGNTHLKTNRRISNPEYQKLTKAIKKTATRDLGDLKKRGIVKQIGRRGPGVHYVLSRNRDIMGTMET